MSYYGNKGCWLDGASYDTWKTTPPEYDEEVFCECCECKGEIYVGDAYYEIDGECFCEYCAEQWFSDHKKVASNEY